MRILVLGQGTTLGQSRSDSVLLDVLESLSDTRIEHIKSPLPAIPRPLRWQPIIDLVEALALRRSLLRHTQRTGPYDRYVLPSTTAALLQPRNVLRRSAVRFDALACENRPGPRGIVTRIIERRALRHVRILLPYSRLQHPGSKRERYTSSIKTIPLPTPISISDLTENVRARNGNAIAYCGSPRKKGLDNLVTSWNLADKPAGSVLRIAGVSRERAELYLHLKRINAGDQIEFIGKLSHEEFVQELKQAHIYLAAPRYEDFGIAALEAMAAGAILLTTESSGPYEARTILKNISPDQVVSGGVKSLAIAIGHIYELSDADTARIRAVGRSAVEDYDYSVVEDCASTDLAHALRQ